MGRGMEDGGRSRVRNSSTHTNAYIHQLLSWGFSLEFIARDCGISIESLEMRLYRERKRNGKARPSKDKLQTEG
jgi:hypothetical protein